MSLHTNKTTEAHIPLDEKNTMNLRFLRTPPKEPWQALLPDADYLCGAVRPYLECYAVRDVPRDWRLAWSPVPLIVPRPGALGFMLFNVETRCGFTIHGEMNLAAVVSFAMGRIKGTPRDMTYVANSYVDGLPFTTQAIAECLKEKLTQVPASVQLIHNACEPENPQRWVLAHYFPCPTGRRFTEEVPFYGSPGEFTPESDKLFEALVDSVTTPGRRASTPDPRQPKKRRVDQHSFVDYFSAAQGQGESV